MAKGAPAPKVDEHAPFHIRIPGSLWDPVTSIMLKERHHSQTATVIVLVQEALDARKRDEGQQTKEREAKRKPRPSKVRQYDGT